MYDCRFQELLIVAVIMYDFRFQELLIVAVMTSSDRRRRNGDNQSVFVTVGTTKFDKLIETVCSKAVLEVRLFQDKAKYTKYNVIDFLVIGLKFLGRVGTHNFLFLIFFIQEKFNFMHGEMAFKMHTIVFCQKT